MSKTRLILVVALVVLTLVAVVPAAGAAPGNGGKSGGDENLELESGKKFTDPKPNRCPLRYCALSTDACTCGTTPVTW